MKTIEFFRRLRTLYEDKAAKYAGTPHESALFLGVKFQSNSRLALDMAFVKSDGEVIRHTLCTKDWSCPRTEDELNDFVTFLSTLP